MHDYQQDYDDQFYRLPRWAQRALIAFACLAISCGCLIEPLFEAFVF